VGDIQAVTGNARAVDLDGKAGLSEFLHQGYFAYAPYPLQDLLDGFALLLQRIQIGAENLDGQSALQAGFRFVHRILRRLGVVEIDSGEGLELLVDGLDQTGLGAVGAGPFRVGLEIDVEFDVEETRRIGAVVRPAEFRGHGGDLGKRAQNLPLPGCDLGRFLE